ncbi:MAG TPA: hypothetical protein VGD98_17905 [Ktedonobacteraceae bacterium]
MPGEKALLALSDKVALFDLTLAIVPRMFLDCAISPALLALLCCGHAGSLLAPPLETPY